MTRLFERPGENYAIYGDAGYSNSRFIKVGYKNHNKLTTAQKEFNRDMSSLRVSVEYGFGRVIQQFAFLDFKKNQKLYLQNLQEQYYVAALLANCQICLRESQVSEYFDCPPPSLEDYLRWEINFVYVSLRGILYTFLQCLIVEICKPTGPNTEW